MASRDVSAEISSYLRGKVWALCVVWTAVILSSLLWNHLQNNRVVREMAEIQARGNCERILAEHSQGGAPCGSELADVEVGSPSGHDGARPAAGRGGGLIQWRLLALPSAPAPPALNDWEAQAFRALLGGERQVNFFDSRNGENRLRLLRSLYAEASCAQCHVHQNKHTGALLGGLSVSIPLGEFKSAAWGLTFSVTLGHALLWLVGLGSIRLGANRLEMQISQRRRAEATISYMESYDQLSGLPNQELFKDRLEMALARARRGQSLLAVLFLNLDLFKKVNSLLGHEAGDRILVAVAQRLQQVLHADETVARMGSDTFTVLLPVLTRDGEASAAAQKLLDSFQEPFRVGEQEVFLSASLGVALFPDNGSNTRSLLQNAEIALQRAKTAGRNSIRFYDPSMNSAASLWMELESDLRKVLHRRELTLFYQPQVDAATGRIVGAEALLRWRHPKHGWLSPEQFIPIAEDAELIDPIGSWVIRCACAQNRAWQQAGLDPIKVAVNLSAKQFQSPDLARQVEQTLLSTGLEPRFLELEITESNIFQDIDKARATMRALKETGIKLAIDDFGTGYSSLAHLKRFPVDFLKIDRSFVADISDRPEDAAIVQAVCLLAESLDLQVIAEGVETSAQAAVLRSLNCHVFQGFHYSRPVAAEEFGKMLAGRDFEHALSPRFEI